MTLCATSKQSSHSPKVRQLITMLPPLLLDTLEERHIVGLSHPVNDVYRVLEKGLC